MGSPRSLLALALLAAAAVAAAGCGGGGGGGEQPVKLFFTSGEQFAPVERELPDGGAETPEAGEEAPAGAPVPELEPAIRALVEGPTGAERRGAVEAQTQIPEGTGVKRVSLDGDEAVVELSGEFLDGVPGAPAERSRAQRQELEGRLAQVTYTATQFEQVRSTRVLVSGGTVAPELDRGDYAKPKGPAPAVRKPRGAEASGVRPLQMRLWRLGYLPRAAVDGLDGYRTRQAVMAFQSWEGLNRDGVAGPITRAALARARRPKPRAGGPPKRIEVYRALGVALLVKGGRTKRALHVSTGAPGTETPAGSFEVFRKERNSWSVPFDTWLPYASYFHNGIAFHEYPQVPPYPASHGCVRVPAPEAPFLYGFAAIGTAVRVY